MSSRWQQARKSKGSPFIPCDRPGNLGSDWEAWNHSPALGHDYAGFDKLVV